MESSVDRVQVGNKLRGLSTGETSLTWRWKKDRKKTEEEENWCSDAVEGTPSLEESIKGEDLNG